MRAILLLSAVLCSLVGARLAQACTGIRLKPGDGSIIAARTMEFAADLRSNIVVIPRRYDYQGTAPGNKPGLKWTTRYGVAGANGFDLPLIVDGLNERGLAVGVFYFPGYAQYQSVSPAELNRALGPWELPTYLLTTCASVDEALAALDGVRVGAAIEDHLGFAPPCHYLINDSLGRCVVVEYVDGKLKTYDNVLGVMSNSPTFDWHLTNLRNYVNLTVTNVPPVAIGDLKLSGFGQGTGTLGLPGDFTPPSRFVRAAFFSQSALPVATAQEGVEQAFHLLNQFDIPKGIARGQEDGHTVADYTLWTSAADLTNRRYYFHTFDSRRIRMVDLDRLDFDSRRIATIPMSGGEVIEDVSPTAK